MIPFNFEDLSIRTDVRLQWESKKDLTPPQGMSRQDLAIWQDEARKINQGLIVKIGERLQ